MDDAKQQLIDKLKSSNNILVTVSRDPSVDQLASCIGLTLLLNKQGKHAAAVFSGKAPSTLEFLQPEDTLEKNTDSLRDFIISLDKGKADKLRYKVEEDVVRIFITPYKTSLSEADLEFTEGDFNVDVVVALGVHKQEDLDQAITAHGRILHDATVTSINTSPDGGLGTINWYDPQASSLSELVTDLAQALEGDLLDAQIATALLTGIVSETGRFSNDKTSSQTMSASAALMAAGANQQLVATKLEAGRSAKASSSKPGDSSVPGEVDPDDGVLEIDHAAAATEENTPPVPPLPPAPAPKLPEPLKPPAEPDKPASNLTAGSKLITEPPTMGGTLTANSRSEQLDPVTDPFSLPVSELPQMLNRKDGTSPQADKPASSAPPAKMKPAPTTWTSPTPPQAQILHTAPAPGSKDTSDLTLTDLEKSVGSPHADPAKLDTVRSEVNRALSGTDSAEPIEALNAQPLGDDLHPADPVPPPEPQSPTPPQPTLPTDPTAPTPPPATPQTDDSNAPPPVPPPIPFQFGNPPPPQ
jgi:hypothetical protein